MPPPRIQCYNVCTCCALSLVLFVYLIFMSVLFM